MFLAFLNLGPSEVAILLVLFLLLFGVDQVPQMARKLGRARAELDRAQREVTDAMKGEDERALADQLAFERERDEHVTSHVSIERMSLEHAADALGIHAAGRTDADLRAAIAERVEPQSSDPAVSGAEKRRSAR